MPGTIASFEGCVGAYVEAFEVGADHSPDLKSGLSTFMAGRAEHVMVD